LADSNGITVVTFLWNGKDRPGWGNVGTNIEYVNRLCRGVARNTTMGVRYVCFMSNHLPKGLRRLFSPGIEVIGFDSPSWRGCLPKLKAFDPEAGLSGRVVILDIDIVVTGSVDDIFGYSGPLMTRSAFKNTPKHRRMSGGDIVLFEAGTHWHFWEMLNLQPRVVEGWSQGKERWVYQSYLDNDGGQLDFLQEHYPNQMYSYKANNLHGSKQLPANCRMVTFHGRPKPGQCSEPWVRRHWV